MNILCTECSKQSQLAICTHTPNNILYNFTIHAFFVVAVLFHFELKPHVPLGYHCIHLSAPQSIVVSIILCICIE